MNESRVKVAMLLELVLLVFGSTFDWAPFCLLSLIKWLNWVVDWAPLAIVSEHIDDVLPTEEMPILRFGEFTLIGNVRKAGDCATSNDL